MATQVEIDAIQNAIIARAEAEGDDGTKLGLGNPSLPPIVVSDKMPPQKRGKGWTPTGAFRALISGIADFLVVPTGTIVAFYGSTIPWGWSLCDGSNGTPDLRNRFIKGASNTGENGTTGGSTSTGATDDATTDSQSTSTSGGSSAANTGGSSAANSGGASTTTTGGPSLTIYPTVLSAGVELATGAHTHEHAHTHTISHTHTMAHTHSIAHTHEHEHVHSGNEPPWTKVVYIMKL